MLKKEKKKIEVYVLKEEIDQILSWEGSDFLIRSMVESEGSVLIHVHNFNLIKNDPLSVRNALKRYMKIYLENTKHTIDFDAWDNYDAILNRMMLGSWWI